jgi:hypothetical protein
MTATVGHAVPLYCWGVVDSVVPPATAEAMREFVAVVPAARPVLDDHLADNFAELLPHVLMADLTRWFVTAVAAGNGRAVADFAAAVEALYVSADADVRNVAEVSFMEHLVIGPGLHERAAIDELRRLAGPATMTDLVRMEEYARRSG